MSSLVIRDGVSLPNLPWASFKSATMTASDGIVTSLPSRFDDVRRNRDAISTNCKSKLHQNLVKLRLCHVSSPIELKSCVFPSNAS
ncbi:hypothetical protein Tco_1064409 [Tanacetum coccineum]